MEKHVHNNFVSNFDGYSTSRTNDDCSNANAENMIDVFFTLQATRSGSEPTTENNQFYQ